MTPSEIVGRIKQARQTAGLTQAQAAARIGWAQSTWAGRESGARMPTLAVVVRMASAVGLTLEVVPSPGNDQEAD